MTESRFFRLLPFKVIFLSIAVWCFILPSLIQGEDPGSNDIIDSMEYNDVSMLKGELVNLRVYNLTRLSISDPSIADVASAEADKLLIVGKAVGQTIFFIWDENGKRTIFVRVFEEDLNLIKFRIEKLIETAEIKNVFTEVNPYEGKVVVSGSIDKEKKDNLSKILNSFGGNILDMTEEGVSDDLVQIDMQITELNETLQKSLGVDWVTPELDHIKLVYTEQKPAQTGDQLSRLTKIGKFNRVGFLEARIDLLVKEGKGRILSKPSLVVASGKNASFQVGGQVPVRTTTSSSGGGVVQENLSYRDFGILMNITPTIRQGKIDITLTVEVSDVDTSLASGADVGFTTRDAQTHLFLDDQQTIILAGLIKQTRGESFNKVPFLGDLPILGMLFRSKTNPTAEKDTELVISLTPTILKVSKPNDSTAADEEEQAEKKKGDAPLDAASDSADEKEAAPGDDAAAEGEVSAEADAEAGEDEAATQEEPKAEDDDEDGAPMDTDASTPEDAGEQTGTEDAVAESEDEQFPPDELAGTDAAVRDDQPKKGSAPKGVSGGSSIDLVVTAQTPEGEDVSELMASYVNGLQKKISQAISFPYEAAEKGWHGTVKLTLHILKDGTLDEVKVKESSGYPIFDKDAVDTTQILAPFDPFPPELNLREIIITIPIVYSQDKAAIDVTAVCEVDVNKAGQEAKPFLASGATYTQLVQEKIAQSAIYPKQAKQLGWEGTVKLNLKILRNGSLEAASIKESSGYKVFDECALTTAKMVAPYSTFPADSNLKELNVTVPITYSLERK